MEQNSTKQKRIPSRRFKTTRKIRPKVTNINEMNLTSREREQHFFNQGYEYAILHLHIGLEKGKLQGLEKRLMKYLDFLKHTQSNGNKKEVQK